MSHVEPDDRARLETVVQRLEGKASARKGWLLLAAAAGWWAHPSRPWGDLVGEEGIYGWRAWILQQAKAPADRVRGPFGRIEELHQDAIRRALGQTHPVRDAFDERFGRLANHFVDACVSMQVFFAASAWHGVRQRAKGARIGQLLVEGIVGFPELSMPSADLLPLLDELFAPHLRDVRLDPAWLAWQQGTVAAIARRIYDSDDFGEDTDGEDTDEE